MLLKASGVAGVADEAKSKGPKVADEAKSAESTKELCREFLKKRSQTE